MRTIRLHARKNMVAAAPKNLQVLTLEEGHPLQLLRRRPTIAGRARAEPNRNFEGTSLDALREMTGTGLGVTFPSVLYVRARTSRGLSDAARVWPARALSAGCHIMAVFCHALK